MARQRNGLEETQFEQKDLHHKVSKQRKKVFDDGDAKGMFAYFKRMVDDNSKFFHTYRVDEEGVNHHGQTILFGCALVTHENVETFEWVFSNWLRCMDDKAPAGILTDQDAAIRKALKVFENITEHVVEDRVWYKPKNCSKEKPSKRNHRIQGYRKYVIREHTRVKVAYHDPSKTEEVCRFDKMMVKFGSLCSKSSVSKDTTDLVMQTLHLLEIQVDEKLSMMKITNGEGEVKGDKGTHVTPSTQRQESCSEVPKDPPMPKRPAHRTTDVRFPSCVEKSLQENSSIPTEISRRKH
ncbi:protein FAR-RED IMPAIRED RESPONSE 1-like [Chenopodium quinoa]|uniref:protein FAR-RED IMPAIRED RESPONSE 1-like n=1 Tax=Chenopodium quinoa TaxID=63459 RepID=UPI000B77EFA9|nr:protein FAR-RED IMPAIRED RESPONSE 1-like [Chenopodium quinoa]